MPEVLPSMVSGDKMSTFESAMKDVLRWEGGFNEIPEDPGGATNFGISLRFYKENIDPMADRDTIMNLTKEEATDIYKVHFWNPYPYDKLPYIIAKKTFNFAINMGTRRAFKLLQRAIMAATGEMIKDDGVIGPKTLKQLGKADPYCVLAALKSEAAGRYRWLILNNPELKVFQSGWLKRAYIN